jgi:hypothetical protein
LCALRFELYSSYFNYTTLHNVLYFSIAFNIFVLGFTTGQLQLRLAEPWPVVPYRGRGPAGCSRPLASHAMASAGRSQPRGGPSRLRPNYSKAVAGRARLHQGRGWPSPHNPLMKFIKFIQKMAIPLFTKFTNVTYTVVLMKPYEWDVKKIRSNATLKNCYNRPKMVAIDIIPRI